MKKLRYKLGSSMYRQKPVSNSTIGTLSKIQKKLQSKENLKYGRRSQKVSFVFVTKHINKHLKKALEDIK